MEQPAPGTTRLDFKLGYRCNNMCRFCAQGDKRTRLPGLDAPDIEQLLTQYSKQFSEIVFTGGEPTLAPGIARWVATAASLGFKVIQIQSNGRAFANPTFCREMAAAGATQFALALHGDSEACHDYLTRAPGSFIQTTRGILNLIEMGQNVVVNVVVTRSNFRNLPGVAALLLRLGVTNFQLAFVHPVGTARTAFTSVVPRKTIASPHIKTALETAIRGRAQVFTEGLPYCFTAGFDQCVVEVNIPRAKIHEQTRIVEDYTSVRINEAKARGPQCPQCAFFNICEGPWIEYPQHYGWDEFIPRTSDADRVIAARIANLHATAI